MSKKIGISGEIKRQCDVEVGNRLKDCLVERKLKIVDVAAAMDMSRSNLENICNGMQGINTEKYKFLFDEFGIEPNEIILGKEFRSAPDMDVMIDRLEMDVRNSSPGSFNKVISEYIRRMAKMIK